MKPYPTDLPAIRAAAARLHGHAHRTPVLTSRTLDHLAGRHLYLKCENLQRVGAFKFRGAFNAVALLTEAEAARGVVTHSSGNHAQALALAASLRGIAATIVMPSTAPAVKRAAVEGYGATIVTCEPTLQAREQATAEVIHRTGATLVHPYDDPRVIAGQGTVGLELLEQVPHLDAIIAPVGGGGLLSGITIAVRGLSETCRVYGAEPTGADDAARSKASGERVRHHQPHTIADGLLTTLGDHTWPVVRDLVDGIYTVEDAEILMAMRLLWERTKLVVEPSGAVPLAVALSEGFREVPGEHVGIVISGGNVDVGRFFEGLGG
jgi:threonine dehydratase